MVPAGKNPKPYVKLAATLASLGMGFFFIERFGLDQLRKNDMVHIDGTVLSILVLAPFVLIISGALVFMVGKMRRL